LGFGSDLPDDQHVVDLIEDEIAEAPEIRLVDVEVRGYSKEPLELRKLVSVDMTGRAQSFFRAGRGRSVTTVSVPSRSVIPTDSVGAPRGG
jgi:hypothetical protein